MAAGEGTSPASRRPRRQPRLYTPWVDRLDRIILTVLGLLCLAAGVVGLLAGTDVLGGPSGGARTVLSAGTRSFAANHGWFWPVLGVAAGLVSLGALAWLLAQGQPRGRSRGRFGRGFGLVGSRLAGRFGTSRRLYVAYDLTGGVYLDSRALTDAVEEDAQAYPDVDAVSCSLVGRRADPLLLMSVRPRPEVDVRRLRGDLEGAVLSRARSAGRADLAAELDIVAAGGGRHRVR
jgi:hypothetical protein